MKNIFYTILIIVVLLAAFMITINWNSIVLWWNRPREGSKCTYASELSYVEGMIRDGKCVPGQSQNENGSNNSSGNSNNSTEYDLQVSNPNGAYMYYQSLSQASQGMIYGKSNVLIPFGQKLKLVKTWQTNVSTQPFGGYYETTYKQYGPTSGFFDTNDVAKINDQRSLIGLGGIA